MLQINHLNKQPTMAQTLARDSRLPSSGTSAALLGIDACLMEGIEAEKYNEILGLDKKGLSAIVVAAAGYRAEGDQYAALQKVRFPRDEVLVEV